MIAGKIKKKAAALFLVLILMSGLTVFAYAYYDEIDDVQNAIEQDGQSLITAEERIASLEEMRSNSEAYLLELSAQLEELTQELTLTNQQLEEKQNELDQIQKELELSQEEAQTQYEDMKKRIQYLYESGASSGTLSSIFSAESFTEMLNRAENYSELTKYDRRMLNEYEKTLDEVSKRQESLIQEKEKIVSIQNDLKNRQGEIQELYQAAYRNMMECLSELDDAQIEQMAIAEKLAAQEALMNELLRQQYEAEAAAAQAAAEAALAEQQRIEQEALEAARAMEEAQEAAVPEAESHVEETQDPALEESVEEPSLEEKPEETVPAETNIPSEDQNTQEEEDKSSDPEKQDSSEEEPESASDMTYLGNFTLTAYCPCSQCCGAYATGHTASGTLATEGVTVAMGGVDFGTKLMINGHIYTVEDRGTAYGHVDIFFSDHASALAFGMQSADVYQLNQ